MLSDITPQSASLLLLWNLFFHLLLRVLHAPVFPALGSLRTGEVLPGSGICTVSLQLDFDLWNQPCPSFGESVMNLSHPLPIFAGASWQVCVFAILVFTLLPGSPSSSTDQILRKTQSPEESQNIQDCSLPSTTWPHCLSFLSLSWKHNPY